MEEPHQQQDQHPAKRARLSPPPATASTATATASTTSTPPPPPPAPSADTAVASAAETLQDAIEKGLAAERAVGITEYVAPDTPRWSGVFKMRYTDFLVNEIGLDGEVVRLRDLGPVGGRKKGRDSGERMKAGDVKEEEEEKEEKEEESAPAEDANSTAPPAPPPAAPPGTEVLEQLTALTDQTTTDACLALFSGARSERIVTPAIESKDSRTQFHGLVRTGFHGLLLTSTDTSNATPNTIVITKSNSASRSADTRRRRGKRGGKNHRSEWSDLGGEYCHFTLYKENKDTMEAVSLLSRLMKLKNGNKIFSFAGTKDRRAVTVQRIAAYRVRAERLAGLNRGGESGLRGGMRLGGFEYKPDQLNLGDLKGNEFVITLRECALVGHDGEKTEDLEALTSTVTSAVERVRKHGFANYFGLQRFGTSSAASTAEIGRLLLLGSYREAVEKILAYDADILQPTTPASSNISQDDRARALACHTFFSSSLNHDFAKASEQIPRKFVAESAMLRAFAQRGLPWGKLDYLGALQAIPRGLRMMYVHAYQSLVWNQVASERLRMARDQVLPGDLVLVEQEEDAAPNNETAQQQDAEPEVDQDGDIIILPPTDPASSTTAGTRNPATQFQRARPLSETEASSGAFSIFDIVLPTPGWDIVYPASLLDVYRSVMARDGGLDPEHMKRGVRDWSLPGSYRKLVARVLDGGCEVEVKRGGKGRKWVDTDLERVEAAAGEKMQDAAAAGEKRKRNDDDGDAAAATEEKKDAQQQQQQGEEEEENIVLLKLRLGTSTYATMALRELMKGGTVAFQPEFGRAGGWGRG